MAEGRAVLVKADSQVLDVLFLDDFQEHTEEAVDRVGVNAVCVHDGECVECAVHQAVAVNQ